MKKLLDNGFVRIGIVISVILDLIIFMIGINTIDGFLILLISNLLIIAFFYGISWIIDGFKK